jgi:hypothetical protein
MVRVRLFVVGVVRGRRSSLVPGRVRCRIDRRAKEIPADV